MIINYLKDVTKTTNGIKFNAIKVTGTNGDIALEAASDDKSVILKGKFLSPVAEFDGITGLGQLERLNALVNAYSDKNDVVEVGRSKKKFMVEQKNPDGSTVVDDLGNPQMDEIEDEIIENFSFKRTDKNGSITSKNTYRPMDRRMIPDQYKFTGQKWDVSFEPTKSAIDLLQMQAGLGIGDTFSVKTDGNTLFLTVGDAGEEGRIMFADNISGAMTRNWTWPLSPVMSLLKQADKAECTMSFLDKGALQITLKTSLAEYNFIMPAKAK